MRCHKCGERIWHMDSANHICYVGASTREYVDSLHNILRKEPMYCEACKDANGEIRKLELRFHGAQPRKLYVDVNLCEKCLSIGGDFIPVIHAGSTSYVTESVKHYLAEITWPLNARVGAIVRILNRDLPDRSDAIAITKKILRLLKEEGL